MPNGDGSFLCANSEETSETVSLTSQRIAKQCLLVARDLRPFPRMQVSAAATHFCSLATLASFLFKRASFATWVTISEMTCENVTYTARIL